MASIVAQSMKSEILQKILSVVAYSNDRWIKLYVFKNSSTRLHPVRIDNTIVFMDNTLHKDEVGYVDFTSLAGVKEFHIDYFEVHEMYRRQGYGREIFMWIENYAKHKGMQTIYLTPYESAIKFWIKMGFFPASNKSDEMIKKLFPASKIVKRYC